MARDAISVKYFYSFALLLRQAGEVQGANGLLALDGGLDADDRVAALAITPATTAAGVATASSR